MRSRRGFRLVGAALAAVGACACTAGPAPRASVDSRGPAVATQSVPSGDASRTAPLAEAPRAPAPRLQELPDFDLPLSVAEAYAAIPHRQTRFRFETAPLRVEERRYLEAMFHLIDQGTRVRVVAWRDLYHRDATPCDPVGRLTVLIRYVDALAPPPDLGAYHAEVRTALVEQRAFFREWLDRGADFEARGGGALAAHPAVQGSSRALRSAYGILMRRLGPGLAGQERQAFFDYHCALDFL